MALVIRPEQKEVFSAANEDQVAAAIARDLEANHPPVVSGIPPERLKLMIRSGMGRAKSHGLMKKYTVALFVEVMFLVAPNFDEYPPVAYIFRRQDLRPDDRMDLVVDTLTDPQWESVRRRSDPLAWGL